MGLIHENLTKQIIDAAFEVHKTLGCGFLEAVYHEALEIEFKLRSISFVSQKQLEIKAEAHLTNVDQAQLHNYLKVTSLKVGLLINFGAPKIEIKRIVK